MSREQLNEMKKYINLVEGTWAYPDSTEKVNQLVQILSTEQTATELKDKLYEIYGDDELYNRLDEVEDSNPAADARYVVMNFLNMHDPLIFNEVKKLQEECECEKEETNEEEEGEESVIDGDDLNEKVFSLETIAESFLDDYGLDTDETLEDAVDNIDDPEEFIDDEEIEKLIDVGDDEDFEDNYEEFDLEELGIDLDLDMNTN